MRVLPAALLSLLLLVIPAAPAGGAGDRRPDCRRTASATLVANRFARVYTYRGDLWACARDTGRRFRLARAYGDDYASGSWRNVKLAGRFVGWTYETYDISCKAACPPEYSPERTQVRAYDVRARRTANAVDWSGAFHLTTGGGIAWLEPAEGDQLVLRGKAPGAEPVVLDSGAIEAAEVRAYRRLILWVRDGVRRWAPLP